MIKTRDVILVRGQTAQITFTLRDHLNARVDLTGAQAYLAIRADMKVPPLVQLSSVSSPPAGWRTGVVIADQTGEHKGEFTVTIIPADTQSLVALGISDPYLYDAWVVLADGSRWPVVSTSRMPLFPEVTTIP